MIRLMNSNESEKYCAHIILLHACPYPMSYAYVFCYVMLYYLRYYHHRLMNHMVYFDTVFSLKRNVLIFVKSKLTRFSLFLWECIYYTSCLVDMLFLTKIIYAKNKHFMLLFQSYFSLYLPSLTIPGEFVFHISIMIFHLKFNQKYTLGFGLVWSHGFIQPHYLCGIWSIATSITLI